MHCSLGPYPFCGSREASAQQLSLFSVTPKYIQQGMLGCLAPSRGQGQHAWRTEEGKKVEKSRFCPFSSVYPASISYSAQAGVPAGARDNGEGGTGDTDGGAGKSIEQLQLPDCVHICVLSSEIEKFLPDYTLLLLA